MYETLPVFCKSWKLKHQDQGMVLLGHACHLVFSGSPSCVKSVGSSGREGTAELAGVVACCCVSVRVTIDSATDDD